MLLRMYSTGCSFNSRTIPLTLGTPIKETSQSLMDFTFEDTFGLTDEEAMSLDYATIDNKWCYWARPVKKTSNGAWKVEFRLCALDTYRKLSGATTIKGLWNKTPTWIDSDTTTPGVSGYMKKRDISLPGLLPTGWVWVEIRVRMNGVLRATIGDTNTLAERNVVLGCFVNKLFDVEDKEAITLSDIVYDISSYNYSTDGGATFTKQFDVEQIEDISYSRLCPYKFYTDVGIPVLWSATVGTTNYPIPKRMYIKRNAPDGLVAETPEPISNTYISTVAGVPNASMTASQIETAFFADFGIIGREFRMNCVYTNADETVVWQDTGTTTPNWVLVTGGIKPNYYEPKQMYFFDDTDILFSTDVLVSSNKPQCIEGTFNLELTDLEMKFGVALVFGPTLLGNIEKSMVELVTYRYVADNTGWYLELDTAVNKIVIPSSKLPYISDSWRAYKLREMEYDRNELARANDYAKNKFWGDIVKGISNGALAGGFAGTHSAAFGLQMGAMSFAGSTLGAYSDMGVSIADNERAQQNKEQLMRNSVDVEYNAGYGFRLLFSNSFIVRIIVPQDDMTDLVKITGYSCTGNLTATIAAGYLQGTPEPNNLIKGMVKDILMSELQMGVWLL